MILGGPWDQSSTLPGFSEALIHVFQPAWNQPLSPAQSQQGGEMGLGSAGRHADGFCLLEAEAAVNHCPRRELQPGAVCEARAAAMCCPQVTGCGQRAPAGGSLFALGSGSAITASARLTPAPQHPSRLANRQSVCVRSLQVMTAPNLPALPAASARWLS